MSLAHDWAAQALRLADPEDAHAAALTALELGAGPRLKSDSWPNLRTSFCALDLPNPLGLAAGFDKDARVPDAMLAAGFGFVECGTVTPLPQAGNPKPRLFRLVRDHGIINRMGFNNAGLEAFVARLKARTREGIVGANIGANKESADRAADYVAGLRAVYPYASYVAANISSPNTPGLRCLQEKGALEDLLGRLREAKLALVAEHGMKPVFLKVAPDIDDKAIADIIELAIQYSLDALIVSNTTTDRPAILQGKWRAEAGGLSGRPLFIPSTDILRRFARALDGRVPLIGVGGVGDGATALAKIKAGASAVQLYSALALQGPGLLRRLLRNLSARLEAEGFKRVSDAVGADLR